MHHAKCFGPLCLLGYELSHSAKKIKSHVDHGRVPHFFKLPSIDLAQDE